MARNCQEGFKRKGSRKGRGLTSSKSDVLSAVCAEGGRYRGGKESRLGRQFVQRQH